MPILDPVIESIFLATVRAGNLEELKNLVTAYNQDYLYFSLDSNGNNVLHIATQNGLYDICEYFLANSDFPALLPNYSMQTPYYLATSMNNPELIQLFQNYNAAELAPPEDNVIILAYAADYSSSEEESDNYSTSPSSCFGSNSDLSDYYA